MNFQHTVVPLVFAG